jgi:hypothetical protein
LDGFALTLAFSRSRFIASVTIARTVSDRFSFVFSHATCSGVSQTFPSIERTATLFEEVGQKSDAERALQSAYLTSAHRFVEAARAHAEIGARLATLLFDRGDDENALLVVGEVIQAFANSPEPSLAVEELLTRWRKSQTASAGAGSALHRTRTGALLYSESYTLSRRRSAPVSSKR